MSVDLAYIVDQKFENIDFSQQSLEPAEYEHCTFSNCMLANVDISRYKFVDCQFENCDLSMTQVNDTAFRDVSFKNCKMLGVRFENCHSFLLKMTFETCLLNDSSFYDLELPETHFQNCMLQNVDFAESNINTSIFDHCDLSQAAFDNTNLEKVDFTTARNFSINPETNRVQQARFSSAHLRGLLDQYNIEIE